MFRMMSINMHMNTLITFWLKITMRTMFHWWYILCLFVFSRTIVWTFAIIATMLFIWCLKNKTLSTLVTKKLFFTVFRMMYVNMSIYFLICWRFKITIRTTLVFFNFMFLIFMFSKYLCQIPTTGNPCFDLNCRQW